MVTAGLGASKGSAALVGCSCWLRLWAGCGSVLLVCMGRVWPAAASSHRPLFASVEPRLGVLGKCEEPDGA